MAMEIVNGYVCTSCADVEKARKGVDPSPTRAAREAQAKDDTAAPGTWTEGPAVTFGGSLARPVDGVTPVGEPAAAAATPLRTRKLDLFV